MKKTIIILLAIMSMSLLPGTYLDKVEADEIKSETKSLESFKLKEEKFDFDGPDLQKFYMSDGWSNGGAFNCIWRKNNITFKDGKMILKIDKEPLGSSKPYSGGEYATNNTYGYGYYSVKTKPIKNDGVVSSFFTYAESPNGGAHEIDIEFTGKDTTKLEFNYFTDGVSAGGFIYDLGFDASLDFHEYGFLWLENSITWYVDGKEAMHIEGNVPSIPGHIIMNAWPGNAPGWLKPFDGKTPLTAEYDFASFKQVDLEDLDLNGEINILDLSIAAQKYNIKSNDNGYKKQVDFNKDGIIDLYDLTSVSKKIME